MRKKGMGYKDLGSRVKGLLFIITLIPYLLHAGGPGSTTTNFLKLATSAREVSLGGALTANPRGASSILTNPAGLSQIEKTSGFLSYNLWIASNYQNIAVAHRLEPHGSFGLGVKMFSYGNITETDTQGNRLGEFSPRDWALSLGWSKAYPFEENIFEVKNLAPGAALKFINSKIKDKASAQAADLGLLLNAKSWNVGLSVTNLGQSLKFEQEASPLPLSVKLGLLIKWPIGLTTEIDALSYRDDSIAGTLGLEYGLGRQFKEELPKDYEILGQIAGSKKKRPIWGTEMMLLRAGYSANTQDIEDATGVSFGFGIIFKPVQLDYAFYPLGIAGQTHHVSLEVRF